MVHLIRLTYMTFRLCTLHIRTILLNRSFLIYLNGPSKNLIENLFAATHLKPSSLIREVNMLDKLSSFRRVMRSLKLPLFILLDYICVCFGNNIYRQVVGILIGTTGAPLVSAELQFNLLDRDC